jgi:hypothetical protein
MPIIKYHLRAFCASFLEQSPLLFAWQNPLRVCACVRARVCMHRHKNHKMKTGTRATILLSFSRVMLTEALCKYDTALITCDR